MLVKSLTVNPFAENTYLLFQEGKAVLIDPGFSNRSEYNAFKTLLSQQKADLKAIVLTHAHVDHILGISSVLDEWDIPVYLNHTDLYLWENFASQAQMFGVRVRPFDFTPEPLPVREEWKVAGFNFNVRFTPGHAPEHVVLYHAGQQLLIGGDTLFKESIGRTDLYKGDYEQLRDSILEEIYTLPDTTQILPGHGPVTTVGHEKQYNPYVSVKEQD